MKVFRNSQSRDVSLALGEAPTGKGPAHSQSGSAGSSALRGVQVQPLTDDIRQELGLSSEVKGVVVSDVADGTPASDAGLQRGDVIEEVNRQPVNSVADFRRLVDQAGKQPVVLLVNRGGSTTFVDVQPE